MILNYLILLLILINPPVTLAAQVEIDGIEFTGVTILTQNDLEGSLEITPGGTLERMKVVRTAENIHNLYKKKGFEQVSIKSRLYSRKGDRSRNESILEFNIIEGKPTRIASIRVTSDFHIQDQNNKFWNEFQTIFLRALNLSAGDILEQEKISVGKRSVQDLLASREFVGAKMDDPRITISEGPTDRKISETTFSAGKWVSLEIPVHLGERVSFGFRGNQTLSQLQLSALIEEQRLVGFGKDYLSVIRVRIEDEYRSLGFSHVQVTTFSYEKSRKRERHVTFHIQEGLRMKIRRVGFEGHSAFSSSDLEERFYKKGSTLIQHHYYFEKDVKKAADGVVEWMKTQGFLSARIISIRTIQDFDQVEVIIYLFELEQTLVHNILCEGNQALTSQTIKSILDIEEGKPLNLAHFNQGIENLKASFRNLGYLDMSIENEGRDDVITYHQDNRRADIFIKMNEGPQFRVGGISIEGILQTKENVLRRELAFQVGEILREDLILQTESRLKRLGIFSAVNIRLTEVPDKKGFKNVQITCQEEVPGLVSGGIGFRNDLGIRGFSEVSYGNLWGKNHTVAFSLSANRRFEQVTAPSEISQPKFIEYNAELFYLWPWFGIHELLFRPSFSVSKRIYKLFSAQTTSLAATWEKPILKQPKLLGSMTYSLERVNQFNAESIEDEGDFRIGAITPALSIDMRDQPLAPTKGFYGVISQEIAAPVLYSQGEPAPVGYTRFQLRSDYYVPVAYETTWYISVRTGFERNLTTVSAKGIPTIKQFSLGGIGSIRGFDEHELNFFRKAVLGTLSYVNYRTQLDMPFAGPMRFGPFLDAANLVLDGFTLIGQLRFGTGFGIHYQTPVGPINFDVGFKINPRPNEDSTKVYFSVGLI